GIEVLRLLLAGREAQGGGEAVAAEPDVGDESALGEIDSEQHVRAWHDLGRQVANASRERRHPKAEAPQHGGEKSVLLEAVTAGAPAGELCFEALHVRGDRTAELNVEVLERDSRGVLVMERPKRIEPSVDRSAVADAREVRADVESKFVCHGGSLQRSAT